MSVNGYVLGNPLLEATIKDELLEPWDCAESEAVIVVWIAIAE